MAVNKLISGQDQGKMAGRVSGGREADRRWELLRRPRWLVGTSEPCPSLACGAMVGTRNGWGSGGASVAVVETTDLGLGHDPPLARRFNLARPGSVAFEGLVGPRVVVVGEVLT